MNNVLMLIWQHANQHLLIGPKVRWQTAEEDFPQHCIHAGHVGQASFLATKKPEQAHINAHTHTHTLSHSAQRR